MVTEASRALKRGCPHRRGEARCVMILTLPDVLALIYFLGAWIAYSIVIEKSAHGRGSLNAQMHGYREQWMLRLLERENRIVDSQVTAALQNGTAFFASTSLIAVGGSLTLLRSTNELMALVSELPFGVAPTAGQWEAKIMGLTIIFAYAFFKFAWAYRLYNYVAIMVGAAPPAKERKTRHAVRLAHRMSHMCSDAGRHFNRGQRAFFFALGYLGWFLGPLPLALATTAVVIAMWRRQFVSESRLAFSNEP
jgi:uncharacterized membrane protein